MENIVYHKDKRIRVHPVRPAQPAADRRVFTISQGKPLLRLGRKLHPDRRFFNSDNHMLLVSNQACNLLQLYSQRMKIEEAFRDLKSLFGFRSLVLKDDSQQRVELLWLLCKKQPTPSAYGVMSMGLSFLLYEKSGYRWSKQRNDSKKRLSLINVIKQVIKERFKSFIKPSFSLPLCEADILSI